MVTEPGRLLTDVEYEFMEVLWKLESATVAQVHAELSTQKTLSYSTALTMLRILEQKGHATSDKQAKSFVYRPLLTKPAFERHTVATVVDRVFHGKPSELVSHLLGSQSLCEKELAAIRALLDAHKGKSE